ncbi:SusC/RagA family TonB-linked outer membrane protein [bacterium]|nr:SusC/RagA family TonB-linked outer membrane protein [bacterium]
MRSKVVLTICLIFTMIPFALWAQGTATVSGKITDEAGDPLPGANVLVQLTNIGAATDVDGNYTFTVPANAVRGQQVSIEARFIGYRTKVEKLTLTPGSHTLDFSLVTDALEMDAIVVTGVVEETPKTKLAFSLGTVSAEALDKVTVSSAETALRGKVAGVKVVRGSGQPGRDASVILRGATSINAEGRSQDPLYIVDGVIIDPSVSGSPLSDINAEDIENIEVVKGAAGASLYGSRAANGVVNITTKRGKGLALNQTRIRIRNEWGFNELRKDYPTNQHHAWRIYEGTDEYIDQNGVKVTPGDFIDGTFFPGEPLKGNFVDPRATGERVLDRFTGNYDPSNPDPARQAQVAFNDNDYKWIATGDILINDDGTPLIDPATGQPAGLRPIPESGPINAVQQFFDPGTFMSNSLSITRNMENTNFSISFSRRLEDGVIDGLSGFDRKTMRMGVDHQFRKNLTISVSGFYSSVAQDRIDEGVGSPFFGMVFHRADVDLKARHAPVGTKTKDFPNGLPVDVGGELFIVPDPTSERDNPIYEPLVADRTNHRNRLMGGATVSYQPVNWMKLEGNFSYDRSTRERTRFWRVGYQDEFDPDITTGRIQRFPQFDEALNGNVTAAFQKTFLNNNLTIRSKARAIFERTELQNTFAEGTNLAVRGVPDLNVANSQQLDVNSAIQQVRSEGYSFITGMDYKDRYIADFLVRRDGSSLFGPDERWHNYFRASGAWRVSQEPWWFTDKIQEFKLRGSYGTAGGRPNFFARFETWTVSDGNVTKGTLGNRDLKPEFAKELELGVDMAFLNKFSLEVTRAKSIVEDQLLEVPLASFAGYETQWQNAGTLETSTWEISLQGAVLRTRDMALSFGVNIDRTRQEVTRLDVAPFNWVPFDTQGLNIFHVEEGFPLGQLWGDRTVTQLEDLLPQGVTQNELSQFQVNDLGHVVWVGEGNNWDEGISKQLWGLETTLSNGEIYEWGIPVQFEDENGVSAGPIGDTTPDFNWSFFTNFDWKGFSFYGLVDAQVGGDIYSQTVDWGFSVEQAQEDADMFGVPDRLKKPTRYWQGGNEDNFIFDGSYVKIRELSVKYSFNRNQLSGVFGGLLNKVSLGIVGRNLFTFDNYHQGYDPEVGIVGNDSGGSDNGGSAVITKIDAFRYPNFRTFTGILEIEF